MEEKIEEMEFKRGSVNFYGGPDERANTFASTARGEFVIFMLGNPAQEKVIEACTGKLCRRGYTR